MQRASKDDFCPAATSAATLASCAALCASIGAPTTSPMANMCGTLVRICLFTAMMPRATDRDTGGSGIDHIAVGAPPHRHQHPVEYLRLRRVRSLESGAQAVGQRLELGDLGLEQNALVALFDALLQWAHQVPIRAGHQTVAQFHHRDLHAERIVDAGHFQSDDAAADDQQALAIGRQFQRAGRVDDARIIRKTRQPRRLGAGRDDALLEIDAPRRRPLPAPRSENGPENFASPVHHLHLALLGEHRQAIGQARRPRGSSRRAARSRSICGGANTMPNAAMSAASSMTLAACSSAFDGMHPTFRHTPPNIGQRSISVTLSPKIRRPECGGVAADPRTEDHQIHGTRRRLRAAAARRRGGRRCRGAAPRRAVATAAGCVGSRRCGGAAAGAAGAAGWRPWLPALARQQGCRQRRGCPGVRHLHGGDQRAGRYLVALLELDGI